MRRLVVIEDEMGEMGREGKARSEGEWERADLSDSGGLPEPVSVVQSG